MSLKDDKENKDKFLARNFIKKDFNAETILTLHFST